ncbi:Transposase [Psychrobacillus sp. OK028]|uniref:transposase n=1 Tax=Psychrobacillus sp. OK028 TaxID=1884359 RepID=UPI00087FDE55|nr:transposase [Psychrobacillus sp. OK028]SDO30272.1 Transposase [Psychrobacillus sp. OK028]
MHGQFRKRYTQTTQEQKMYAVQEVLQSGRGRKEVAEELNVSVNSITTWIRKFKEIGENALTSYSQDEIIRLKEIEKKYNEQLKLEMLKKQPIYIHLKKLPYPKKIKKL